MICWLGCGLTLAFAQTPISPPNASPNAPFAAQGRDGAELSQRQDELHALEGTLKQSDAARRALEAEVEGMRNDRARLNAALIETAQKARTLEAQISGIEARLAQAEKQQQSVQHSLDGRRDVVAQVLAALQRLGRNRPPAVLVRPQDMLEAVRSSILLGAVVPELRAQTEALAADLQEMVRLKQVQQQERARLKVQMDDLSLQSQRTAALVNARQGAIARGEQQITDQREQEKELARQALDLRDLIARMEKDNGLAALAARQADLARSQGSAAGDGGLGQNARLAPAMDFVQAKGLLPLPVAGVVVKTFGAPDGFGASEKGLSIATRAGALVSSPTDGWVAFAGPWRSYGQLLIINAGGGYYVVLAGMQQINVELGQFVLAGEPVGVMSAAGAKPVTGRAMGAAQAIAQAAPQLVPQAVLYVEFRKDGVAIDPAPWWAKPELEKVRG
jgi:septal ring factor EnvC (AmiA/AmiB activator)